MSLCVMHKGLQEASTCIDPAVRDKVLQEYAFLQLAAAQVFASHDSFCFVIVLSGLCVKFKSSDICHRFLLACNSFSDSKRNFVRCRTQSLRVNTM